MPSVPGIDSRYNYALCIMHTGVLCSPTILHFLMLWSHTVRTRPVFHTFTARNSSLVFRYMFFVNFRTRIMAPIYMDLQGENLPGLALLSVIILFVLTITFLALCTSCKRWGLLWNMSQLCVSLSFTLSGFSFICSFTTATFQDSTFKFVSSRNLSGIRCDPVISESAEKRHMLHTWHKLSLLLRCKQKNRK